MSSKTQEAQKEASDAGSDSDSPQPTGGRKTKNNQVQQQNNNQGSQGGGGQREDPRLAQQAAQLQQLQQQQPNIAGGRIAPVRQSRILDRPPKKGEKDSSLKIKIELDLEVEVDLYARVKGDVTIGLM